MTGGSKGQRNVVFFLLGVKKALQIFYYGTGVAPVP
jgi:hypothetical protein